jgi:hypothetical protein
MTDINEQATQNIHVQLATTKTNALAVVSFVFALLGVFVTWFIPLISQVIAIISGHIARSQIRKSEVPQGGDGLALAGLIIGYVMIGIGLIPILFIGGLAAFWN